MRTREKIIRYDEAWEPQLMMAVVLFAVVRNSTGSKGRRKADIEIHEEIHEEDAKSRFDGIDRPAKDHWSGFRKSKIPGRARSGNN